MITELLLADSFRSRLEGLRANLPPSILLSGEVGVGLATIAHYLSQHIEQIIQPLNTKGEVDQNAGSISIEVIRSLYQATRGKAQQDFAIIIDDADRMTIPAQQAFLKLLEEPPASAHFILTSHVPEKLLATIQSRVLMIRVPQISRTQSMSYLKRQRIDEETIRQLLFVADGRPALLHTLAHNTRKRQETTGLMRDARAYLSGDQFAKFVVISRYSDRGSSLKLIDAALKILSFTMSQKPDIELTRQMNRLITISEYIAAGGNVKLQLTRFVV